MPGQRNPDIETPILVWNSLTEVDEIRGSKYLLARGTKHEHKGGHARNRSYYSCLEHGLASAPLLESSRKARRVGPVPNRKESAMRALAGVLVAVVLAGPVARADGLPQQEQKVEEVGAIKRTEAEKMRAIADYYQRTGKTASANYYREKAEKTEGSEAAKSIFVRVKSAPGSSRRESLQMQELLTKSITRETPHRVVSSDKGADMILEVEIKPVIRPGH